MRRVLAPRPFRWSVRLRILASILLVTALGMTVAGFVTFLVQRDRTLDEIEDRLLARVESARDVLASPDEQQTYGSTRDALRALIARFVPAHDESSLGLIDGQPAYVPNLEGDFAIESDTALVARFVAEASDGAVHRGSAQTETGSLRYITAPLTVPGDAEVGLYVVTINVDEELNELTASFMTFAAVSVGALAAIGLVGWFVAGRLLRPIRSLSAAASRITASERRERIPVDGDDDVSELTRTVNDMLDRLDSALTGQRQLLDDVRHELKTPITIVRGHLELLDPAEVADVVATRTLAIDELDRMAGLVDDIEAYAETQAAPPIRLEAPVAELTRSVFERATVLSQHRWQLAEVAEATVSIDSARITQAWLQLADNAAKYAPADSLIRIGSTVRNGTVRESTVLETTVELWVQDEGPGIPVGSEERVFERFGRIDTGRGIRGSGLGLPIVRSIARAHGGDVELARVGQGSRFTIVLPTAGAL